MLSLTQTTGYAIQALSSLTDHESDTLFIRDIARLSGVPAPYLAKIIKRLNDAGIVNCKRGLRGGVWLSRPASEITLLDISHAMDGPEWLSSCLLGNAECSDARSCPAHEFWKKERAAVHDELQARTLAQVAQFYSRQKKSLQRR